MQNFLAGPFSACCALRRACERAAQSYYGSLTCCAWSSDGRYVAAGGEDDLVAVFGLGERCVVAWGEGLSSFITAVAFDCRRGVLPCTSTGQDFMPSAVQDADCMTQ